MKENLAIIVGIMSVFIIFYRIIFLMLPMLLIGFKNNNLSKIMESLTLLI